MAGTIKGISVSIGGDTVDLKNSLKDVEKTSKSLQSELNAVNKSLKFDPSNSVLLAQKQEILEEKISVTKETLKKLESVQSQVEEQAKSGDLGTDKYRAYQREIETTKSVLNNLEKQLDDTKNAQNDFESKSNSTNLAPGTREVKDLKNEIGKLTDEAKKTDLSNLKKEVDNVKSSASELKDTLKETATGIGTGLAAAGGGVATAIMSYNSVDDALNHLQAQTGMSNDEIEKLKGTMENVYSGNYGEDMKDIANVMASVAQFTGETDPDKIQKITENVFALSDTYQYDYAESLRAVDMLMQQFGLSSDEAFNLIVRGTQKGLNKNGDLLDTINEYSVHYKQLGYTAEEFFNSLENGSAAGTFSVDKLGDAMKEFGIRSKDTASSTVEAFTLLGYSASASSKDIEKAKDEVAKLEKNLSYAKAEQKNFNESTSELTKQKNADKIAEYSEKLETAKNKLAELTGNTDGSKKSMEELQAKFAAGGDTAKEATKEILDQLFALDDKVLQNQIGVDLFGTMWEDLGIDGVKALMNVTGEADKTKQSMQAIQDIEYDDLGNRLEKLGRKTQTDVINPLVEKFFPKFEDGVDWAAEHLDELIPIVKGLGKQVAIVWGVKKATEITKGVVKLIDNYKTLATATKTATDGQKGLNAAQKANVIGLVVGAVLSLISAIDAYNETQWENSSLKKEIDKTKELTDDWNNLADEMTSKIDEINDTKLSLKVDFEDVEKMKERLQEIIKDGTIDENEKGEYKTIIDLLGEKVDGFETNWSNLNLEEVNGKIKITDNIDTVNKNLDDLIKKWELTQAKMTMSEMYNSLKTESAKKEIEVESLKEESASDDKSIGNFVNYIYENSKLSVDEAKVIADEIVKANGDIEKAGKSIREQVKKGSLDSKKYDNLYKNTHYLGGKDYLTSLFYDYKSEEHIKEYTDRITDYNKSIKNAETQLSKTRDKTDDLYGSLKILSGGQGAYNDYIKLSTEYGMSHEAVLDLIKDKGIKTWSDLEKAAQEKGNEIVGYNTNTVRKSKGAYEREFHPEISVSNRLDETKSTIENKSVELETATNTVMKNAQNAANIGGWFGLGGGLVGQIIGGIFGRNGDMENAGQISADNAKLGTGKVSLFSKGISLIGSFIGGILSKNGDSKNAGKTIINKTNSGIGDTYKEGKNKGEDYAQGYNNGIAGMIGTVIKTAGNLAVEALKATQKAQESNSPSKKSRKLGNDNGDGYVLGIIDKKDDAAEAGEALVENALAEMQNRQNDINKFATGMFGNLNKINNAQKNLNTANLSNTLENINGIKSAGINSTRNYSNMNTVNNSPTVIANVYLQGTSISNETDIDLLATKVSNKLGEMVIDTGMDWG